MVFAVWSGVTYASTCLVKWSWKTKTLATQGDWSNSIVVSILVKSTCRRSRGAVATMGHKGVLGVPPSYWRQCLQALITCLICLTIPGHQKCSCSRERVWSWPWCPASQGHPFRAAVWCDLGTMNNNRSSFSPLGWSASRGHLGGKWSSGNSSTLSGPPCSLYTHQEASSDQLSS